MSESIHIRPVHPNDAQALYAISKDPQVARTLLQLPSQELPQTEKWLSSSQPGQHRLVAERNGRLVGILTLTQSHNPRRYHSADIGVMVAADAWGQGVGTALMEAGVNLADNWLNLIRVELEVVSHNAAAIHLYEKFGFEIEGTRRMAVFGDGRFNDEHVMARIIPNAPIAYPKQPPVLPQAEGVANISIRPVHSDDASALAAMYRHPAVARTTNQLPSQEESATVERVENPRPGSQRLVAVAEHDDGTQKVVGNIHIHQHQNPRTRHVGGLGMMVHPNYWNMGIGSQLMDGIIDIADNWLNLTRVELVVNPENAHAIRLYKKFGFEREGTKQLYNYGDGRWADAHIMGRLKQ